MIFSFFFINAPIFVMGRFFNTSTERVCGHFKSVDWVKSPAKSVKVIGIGLTNILLICLKNSSNRKMLKLEIPA